MAPIPPIPNRPSFTRKVAARVSSLIAKFEALSSTPATRKSPLPRKRTIASIVTPGASTLPRSQIRRSIRKTFARWEVQDVERPVVKITPPPKRIIRKGKARMVAGRRRVSLPEQKRTVLAAAAAARRVVSEELDGPVPMSVPLESVSTSDTSASEATSEALAPPVAKIVPSSFFRQLVVEEAPPQQRTGVFTDSEDEALLVVQEMVKVDSRKFRIRRQGTTGSLWKRRITPPKISVRDLVSRFRVGEAKEPAGDVAGGDEEDAQESETESDEENPSEVVHEDRSLETEESSSDSEAPVAPHPPLAASQEISHVVVHGDLVMPETSPATHIRIIGGDSINKPFIALTRLDTPPLPSSKKYRKTPPPLSFFRAKARRSQYSIAPSVGSNTGESESSSVRTGTTTGSTTSSGSCYLSSSYSSSKMSFRGGITICAGLPAASIITPVPVNAVANSAILAMVSRVNELGGFKL